MKRIDIMSQAELRAEKSRLTGATSKRAKKRLFGVVRELNTRFDHLSTFLPSQDGYHHFYRRAHETV